MHSCDKILSINAHPNAHPNLINFKLDFDVNCESKITAMRLLFTALACLISVSVFGQGWEIIGNTGTGCSVDQTNEGGFIVFGWGLEQSSPHLQQLKFDTFGNEEWLQSYGTTTSSSYIYGQQTGDGGYISLARHSGEAILLKTDENGNEEWSKIIAGYQIFPSSENLDYMTPKGVRQTTDGGYVLLIQGGSNDWTDYVSFSLVKTDLNGNLQFFENFSNISSDFIADEIHISNDGSYIILAHTETPGGDPETESLIKTNENGEEEWMLNIDGSFVGGYISCTISNDDSYIVCTSDWIGDILTTNMKKIDANGNVVWEQNHQDAGCVQVQKTNDGGYVYTGCSIESGEQLIIVKTNQYGVEQWRQVHEAQTLGGVWSWGYSIQQTIDGGYIVSGIVTTDFESAMNIYLIKTDSEGTLSSEFTIPTPTPKKLEKVVDALGREVNHTTNQILFHIYDDGSVEKKFVVE